MLSIRTSQIGPLRHAAARAARRISASSSSAIGCPAATAPLRSVHAPQLARHLDIDARRVSRLHLERRGHVVRQRHAEQRRDTAAITPRLTIARILFTSWALAGSSRKFASRTSGTTISDATIASRQQLADDFQAVRLQHAVEEPEDRQRDEPAVDGRGDAVGGEEPAAARGQERIGPLAEAEQPRAELSLNHGRRFLPQVRNLQQVGQDVVAVEPHQRVGVEQQRADRARRTSRSGTGD